MDNKIKNQEEKKDPKKDILNIVKQFVSYFEEIDRSEKDGDCSEHSSGV